jgi:hypothetical protein
MRLARSYFHLAVWLDRWPYVIGDLIRRARGWSPIGRRVGIFLVPNGIDFLPADHLVGLVQAFNPDFPDELIRLEKTLVYERKGMAYTTELVVAAAALHWHGPSRLLTTWTAIRIADASSFATRSYQETVATGRLVLL